MHAPVFSSVHSPVLATGALSPHILACFAGPAACRGSSFIPCRNHAPILLSLTSFKHLPKNWPRSWCLQFITSQQWVDMFCFSSIGFSLFLCQARILHSGAGTLPGRHSQNTRVSLSSFLTTYLSCFPHRSLQKAQPNPLGSEQRQLPKDIFPLQWINEFFYFCLELHNRFTFTWIFLCGPKYQEDVLSGTTVKKILKYKIKQILYSLSQTWKKSKCHSF